MNEPLLTITDPQLDRYATLHLIPWWDQDRLSQAHVMVVGAGALGNEVVKNLALLGVGHILIIDCDVVETSNLSRSVFFRMADRGRRKVEVVAERVHELNPDVRVALLHGDVTCDVGLGVYRQMDVVLGCLDNRAARVAVSRACWRMGIPWIDGALDVLMGIVRFFIPPESACYECTMTEQDYALLNLHYSCPMLAPADFVHGRMLTTPTSAALIGAVQVQEAVKLLHALPVPAGQGWYFNGNTYRATLLAYSRRDNCYGHETYDAIIDLEAGVANLTVGALLDLAARHVGAAVTLLLDRDLVRTFYCPRCTQTQVVYRPYDLVVPAQVPCPQCGNNRLPDVTTRVARDAVVDAVPLQQLGMPLQQVVVVETPQQRFYCALNGDQAVLLPGWGSHYGDRGRQSGVAQAAAGDPPAPSAP